MSLRLYFFLCISFGATLHGSVAIQDLCTTNTTLFAVSADNKPFQLDAMWAEESRYVGAKLQQNALNGTNDIPIQIPLSSDQIEMLNDYLLQLKNENRKSGKLKKSLKSKISGGDRSQETLHVKVKELSELFSLIRVMGLEKLKPIALAEFLFLLKKETSLAQFVSNAQLVTELALPHELTHAPVKLLSAEDQEFLRAQLCVTLKNEKSLLYCSVSPDSCYVVIAGPLKKDRSFFEVFDLKSGDSVYYVVLDYKIKGLYFCDTERIITWGKKQVNLWDSFGLSNATPAEWKELYKDSKRIWGAALSADRRHVALALDERIIVLGILKNHSEASKKETRSLFAPPAHKRDNKKTNHSTIVFGNNDQWIVEVRPGGDLLFYQWEKEKCVAYKKNSGADYRCFYVNGSKFVTISDTHEIRVWNCQQDTVEPITEGKIPLLSYDIISPGEFTELNSGKVKIFCDTSSQEFIDNLAFLPTRKMSSEIVVDDGAPGMSRHDVRGESYQKLPLSPSLSLQGAYLSQQGSVFLGIGPGGLVKVWHLGNQEILDFVSSSMPLEQALFVQYLINQLRKENTDLTELTKAYHLRRIFDECNKTFRELIFATFPDFRKAWEDNRPLLNSFTSSTSNSTTTLKSTGKLVRSASSQHRRSTTSNRPATSVVSQDSSQICSPRRRRSYTSGAQGETSVSSETCLSPRGTIQTASPRVRTQDSSQIELSMSQERIKSPKRKMLGNSGAQAETSVSSETYSSPRGTRHTGSPRVRKQDSSRTALSMSQERIKSPQRKVLGASGAQAETSNSQEIYSSPRGTRHTGSPRVRKQDSPLTELSMSKEGMKSSTMSTTEASHSGAARGVSQDEHAEDQAQQVVQQKSSTELSIALTDDGLTQESESPTMSTTQMSCSRTNTGVSQDEYSSSGQQSSSGSQIVEFIAQDHPDTPRVTEHDASEIVLVTPRPERSFTSTGSSFERTSTSSEGTNTTYERRVEKSSASKDISNEVEEPFCTSDLISLKALVGLQASSEKVDTSPESTWKSSLKLSQSGEHVAHKLYKTAAIFYTEGKYEEAYRSFQSLYDFSESKVYKALAAQVLGEMCFFGQGVEYNPAIAFKFFEKSSKQDVDKVVQAYACARLGEMYLYGYGVKHSQMNALYYLNQVVAHQQDPLVKKIDGEATFKSMILALFLLHRAQCKDLKIDSGAEPVVSLYEQAMELCKETCNKSGQDCARAWLYRGRLLLTRDNKVSQAMNCFEIALSKATRSSNELLAAEAYYRLGKLHYTSSVDLAQAKAYLEKARATSTNSWICPAADLYLGHIAFRESPSKKILPLQALMCYERALSHPYNLRVQSEAAYQIARIYELSDANLSQRKWEVLEDHFKLLKKKWEKVFQYDTKAVATCEVLGIHHIGAHFSLANQYFKGTPYVGIDLQEAIKHFKFVAEESLEPAQIEEARLKLEAILKKDMIVKEN